MPSPDQSENATGRPEGFVSVPESPAIDPPRGSIISAEPELALFKTFVRESNRIEGIHRQPLKRELRAHAELLTRPELTVFHLARFVDQVQPGAELRIREGMNVRVGNHVAPAGGSNVGFSLKLLCDDVSRGADPYLIHQRYEHLHPFMDGNGRSGRAVWMWQMVNQKCAGHVLRMGFLHLFYYQSLSAWRGA